MLLRQDRFHIHPILCAKIVQGERKTEQTERKMKFTSIFSRCSRFSQKRKELVHFLFPNRSLSLLFSLSLHHFRDLSVPKDPNVPKKDLSVPKRP